MRINTIFTVLLLLGLAAGIAAQNHAENFVLGGSSIQVLDGKGAFSTVFNNPGSAQGIAMDFDNKHVVYGEGTTKGWLRVDPGTGVVSTMLINTGIFDYPTEVVVDQNGDYIVAGAGPLGVTGYGLYRISGTAITTIATTLKMGLSTSFTGGMVIDIDTGNYVLQGYGGSAGPHPLISVAPDGTFTTITANYSTLGGPRYQMTQDLRTGDYYVGGNDSVQGFLVRVKRNGTSAVVATSTDRFAYNVLTVDRGTSIAPRMVHPYRGNLYYTDLKTFAVTTVVVNGTSVSPRSITILGSRNLQSIRTAPGTYTLRFSFPGFAGKGYAAGLTLSGVRPGVPLPDGRNVLLNPDVLTFLTIGNLLPGIFNAGPAVLDKNGEAQGTLNVSKLPKLGLPVHLVVVVLDGAAPLGLAVISDPYVMQL